jgi:amidase
VGKPIRVAVVAAPPGGSCDPVVSGMVRRAADALANAGYDVVEAYPPRYEEVVTTWVRLLLGDFASVMEQLVPLMGEGARPFWRRSTAPCRPCPAWPRMSQLLALRHGLGRAWSQFTPSRRRCCCARMT